MAHYYESEEFEENAKKSGAFRYKREQIERIIEDKKSMSYKKLGQKWNRSANAMRKLVLRHSLILLCVSGVYAQDVYIEPYPWTDIGDYNCEGNAYTNRYINPKPGELGCIRNVFVHAYGWEFPPNNYWFTSHEGMTCTHTLLEIVCGMTIGDACTIAYEVSCYEAES